MRKNTKVEVLSTSHLSFALMRFKKMTRGMSGFWISMHFGGILGFTFIRKQDSCFKKICSWSVDFRHYMYVSLDTLQHQLDTKEVEEERPYQLYPASWFFWWAIPGEPTPPRATIQQSCLETKCFGSRLDLFCFHAASACHAPACFHFCHHLNPLLHFRNGRIGIP